MYIIYKTMYTILKYIIKNLNYYTLCDVHDENG